MAFDQWDDLFLSGGFRPRAELLGGLTLAEVSTCPDGAAHSIYQELWHVTMVLEMSLEQGRVALESWPLSEHFPATQDPPDRATWDHLVTRFLDASRDAVERAAGRGWLDTPEPGYEDYGLRWRDGLEFLAVHTAYHMGKIVLLRQVLGAWPPTGSTAASG